MLTEYGYLEQKEGLVEQARALYERALAVDPNQIDAAANLGIIDAQTGDLSAAVRLLGGAFRLAPGKSDIGIDLARVYCAEGQIENARADVLQVLRFNPDLTAAKQMLNGLSATPPACGL